MNELLLAAAGHAAAVASSPEEGQRFVVMKARPVLEVFTRRLQPMAGPLLVHCSLCSLAV